MNWSERLPDNERQRLEGKRYRITVATLDRRRFTYHVSSCLDDRKALVIASEVHHRSNPALSDRVYEVIEVAKVEGNVPDGTDLCDRAEW